MSTNEEQAKLDKVVEGSGLSRREFLRNAGFVIGGASLGSMAFLNACNSGTSSTVTKTVTAGAGTTTTVTVTAPAVTVTGTGTTGAAPANLVNLNVNGIDYWGVVSPEWTLAYVLREKLGLIATKRGCDWGDCGVCVILMDGRPVMSCVVLALEASGKKLETLEGLAPKVGATLDPLQQAFIDNDAMQCGFCTAGQIMTAKALLAFKPSPTVAEIKEFMAGTICRCGAYMGIIAAVKSRAK
jgi:aerobic-type carbon monoxide dehydrogenase small subunit (CoxS/CutS family)